jgi:hypothetical protein
MLSAGPPGRSIEYGLPVNRRSWFGHRVVVGAWGAIVVAALPSARTHAQEGPAHGAFVHRDAMTYAVAHATCPTFTSAESMVEQSASPHGDSLLASQCVVAGYVTLGAGDNAQWAAATYRHVMVYSHDSAGDNPDATQDTLMWDDVVLYATQGGGGGTLRPIWHDAYDRAETWELHVAGAPQAGGYLVSLMYCVNGTGGCHQDFMLRHHGVWVDVHETYLNDLPKPVREGLWHDLHIDTRTLHADGPIYRPTDANCCPSGGVLAVDLALRGDSLTLLNYHIQPSTPASQ